MKTILIGWPDEKAEGAAQVVSFDGKQSAILEKAKREHVHPVGIKHLALCELRVLDRAIKIELNPTEKQSDKKKAK